KTDFDFHTPEHARDAFADEQTILRTGKPLIGKVERISGPGGKVRWVSATKVPITDAAGGVAGIVGISRDITERMRTEEELSKANEKLEAWVMALERRTREMALISEMTELFQACYTIEEAYAVIVRIANQLFGTQSGQLGILNDSREAVEIVAQWGSDTPP